MNISKQSKRFHNLLSCHKSFITLPISKNVGFEPEQDMKDDAEPVVVVAGLDGCCCDNEPYASELLLTYVVCVLKLSLATASVLKFGITRRPRSIFNTLYSIFIKTSIILPVLINVKQESLIGRVFDDVETIVVETIE
ncbi:hypothetical protein HDU79_011970, partial [Rhizoclosmatium sp. JEL0117]